MGKAGEGCDFRAGQAFNEAQGQGFLVGLGEALEGCKDGVLDGGNAGLPNFVERDATHAAAIEIGGLVASNGGNPGAEGFEGMQLFDFAPGVGENVLQDVLHLGGRELSDEDGVDVGRKAFVEDAEFRR